MKIYILLFAAILITMLLQANNIATVSGLTIIKEIAVPAIIVEKDTIPVVNLPTVIIERNRE
jgi:hypothetical protein